MKHCWRAATADFDGFHSEQSQKRSLAQSYQSTYMTLHNPSTPSVAPTASIGKWVSIWRPSNLRKYFRESDFFFNNVLCSDLRHYYRFLILICVRIHISRGYSPYLVENISILNSIMSNMLILILQLLEVRVGISREMWPDTHNRKWVNQKPM